MNFDSARDDIRRMLIRMQATRKLLELDLDETTEPWQVVDAAEVFAGPSSQEMVAAYDAAEFVSESAPRNEWWRDEMERNWPKNFRRKRPWWRPWGSK